MRIIGKIGASFVTVLSGSYMYHVYNYDDRKFVLQNFLPNVVDNISKAGLHLLGLMVANFPKQALQLSQSEHLFIRNTTQDILASARYPPDFDLREVLKSCPMDTFVGLCRNPLFVDELFESGDQILTCNEHEFLNNSLKDLLSSLPTVDLDNCTKSFTDSVFYGGKSGRHLYKTHSWSLVDDIDLDTVSADVAVSLFLKALRKHSELHKHRLLIVKNNGLDLLRIICEHYVSDKNIRLLSCIIGNLALDEESTQHIVEKGWLNYLKKWTKFKDMTISSNALRALANLDGNGERGCKYEDGVFVVHPTKQMRCCKPEVDIVFVHGLRGSPFRTWRSRDNMGYKTRTDCWPRDWLPIDVPNCRVIMVEYGSELSDWTTQCFVQPEISSITYRSTEMRRKLARAGVGQRPIIWVAHSMGGLLVKQMLVDSSKNPGFRALSENTRGVVFYAVPHKGSDIASLVSGKARFVLRPSFEVKALQKGSALLETIHESFMKYISENDINVLSYCETEPARIVNKDTFIVPRESAEIGVGEFIELKANHFCVCKPTNPSDLCYVNTVHFVKTHIAPQSPYATVVLF